MAAKNVTRRIIALAASIILLSAIVGYAGWVVIYQMNGNVTEIQPPVYFTPGPNNGTTGLGGGVINVTVGPNGTSATVSFNVTYGTTWLLNALNITNNDSTTYYGQLCVEKPITSGTGVITSANASVVDPTTNTIVATVDLTTNGACSGVFTIPANGNLTVDFNTTLAEGTPLDNSPVSFTVQLYYSAENPLPSIPS